MESPAKHTIAIASGKGGVGKSIVTLNLARTGARSVRRHPLRLIALACAGAVTALLLLLHGPTPAGSHTTMLPSPTTATAAR